MTSIYPDLVMLILWLRLSTDIIFFKDFGSPELLKDRDLTDIEGDERTIVNLLVAQI